MVLWRVTLGKRHCQCMWFCPWIWTIQRVLRRIPQRRCECEVEEGTLERNTEGEQEKIWWMRSRLWNPERGKGQSKFLLGPALCLFFNVTLVIFFFFNQMMVNFYFLFFCFPLCFGLVDHGQPGKVRFPLLRIELASSQDFQLQPAFTNLLVNRSIGVDRDVTFTCAVKNLGRYRVRSVSIWN